MGDSLYRSNEEVREHARKSALGGRPIFANPHIGADAELWFEGYREVPEAQRGTRPDLLPEFRAVTRRARGKRGGDFGFSLSSKKPGRRGIHAEVSVRESAPKAISTLSADEIATRIAYHEGVLRDSVCVERRTRARRALAKLRAAVPAVPARTPRPWAVDGVGL